MTHLYTPQVPKLQVSKYCFFAFNVFLATLNVVGLVNKRTCIFLEQNGATVAWARDSCNSDFYMKIILYN